MRTTPGIILTGLVACFLLTGCISAKQKEELDASRKAIESRQPEEAIDHANRFLAQTPRGTGAAEALYLRGRAYEERIAASPAEVAANLQAARNSYLQALAQSPSAVLEGYIRSSLANVAYFQDDYPTAIEQWATAYGKLDRSDLKGWALYRIGVSQQRLSRFAEADQTFQIVCDRFPNTVQAHRARQHQGIRGFHVQFAAFSNISSADRALATLRKQGIHAVRVVNSTGQHVLRAGPFPGYFQSLDIKFRASKTFPDAIILP